MAVIVGLTGSIGTGKSTVARFFARQGAYVIDFDRLSRDAVKKGAPALKEIKEQFGGGVLTPEGELDRNAMGEIVFSDEKKRHELNAIVHPKVFAEDQKLTQAILKCDSEAVIVKEIPLLTQTGNDPKKAVDVIVVVGSSPETQVERVCARGFSKEEALNRVHAQKPIKETARVADFIIDNDNDLFHTEKQVETIFHRLSRGDDANHP